MIPLLGPHIAHLMEEISGQSNTMWKSPHSEVILNLTTGEGSVGFGIDFKTALRDVSVAGEDADQVNPNPESIESALSDQQNEDLAFIVIRQEKVAAQSTENLPSEFRPNKDDVDQQSMNIRPGAGAVLDVHLQSNGTFVGTSSMPGRQEPQGPDSSLGLGLNNNQADPKTSVLNSSLTAEPLQLNTPPQKEMKPRSVLSPGKESTNHEMRQLSQKEAVDAAVRPVESSLFSKLTQMTAPRKELISIPTLPMENNEKFQKNGESLLARQSSPEDPKMVVGRMPDTLNDNGFVRQRLLLMPPTEQGQAFKPLTAQETTGPITIPIDNATNTPMSEKMSWVHNGSGGMSVNDGWEPGNSGPQVSRVMSELSTVIDRAIWRQVNGRSQARIQLKPAILGQLNLNIITDQLKVSVEIRAENFLARDYLEMNMHLLKSELQDSGLEVDRIEVLIDQDMNNPHGQSRRTVNKQALRMTNQNGENTSAEEQNDENDNHPRLPKDAENRIDCFA